MSLARKWRKPPPPHGLHPFQVRLMDSTGDIRSAFFYTAEDNPYFDLEEAREGMAFTFSEPYLRPPPGVLPGMGIDMGAWCPVPGAGTGKRGT